MKKLSYGSVNLYKINFFIQKKTVAIFYFDGAISTLFIRGKYKLSFITDKNQLERGPKPS